MAVLQGNGQLDEHTNFSLSRSIVYGEFFANVCWSFLQGMVALLGENPWSLFVHAIIAFPFQSWFKDGVFPWLWKVKLSTGGSQDKSMLLFLIEMQMNGKRYHDSPHGIIGLEFLIMQHQWFMIWNVSCSPIWGSFLSRFSSRRDHSVSSSQKTPPFCPAFLQISFRL